MMGSPVQIRASAYLLGSGLTVGDASQIAVGVGTGALAWVTSKLAHRTKEEVDLSREGLSLTRESIEALDIPFLVASFDLEYPNLNLSPVFEGDREEPVDAEWRIAMELENVGRGPAVLFGAIATSPDAATSSEGLWRVEMVLKPGEVQELSVSTTVDPTPGQELLVLLYYRSASGIRYVTKHRIRVLKNGRTARIDIRREVASS
jgi:hypothetical protein